MKKLLGTVGLSLAVVLAMSLPTASVLAASASVSRSYDSDQPIAPGNIVSLASQDGKTVTPANSTNSSRLIGVAVSSQGSVISVNPDKAKVQVASNGVADVLVSDVNGSVEKGDKIAVSPFDGIGMKSGPGERIIGIAQQSFSSTAQPLATKQVTDKAGKSKTLRIGKVSLQIVVGIDDAANAELKNLNGLQKVVQSVTGRVIATPRIVLALIIAVVTMATLIVMIYSAVYGSILSIGRNPLAKGSIMSALKEVLWLSVVAVISGSGMIYLLLS